MSAADLRPLLAQVGCPTRLTALGRISVVLLPCRGGGAAVVRLLEVILRIPLVGIGHTDNTRVEYS